MAAGGAYTKMVRVLRVGLPLLGIALLSTIFLVGEDDSLDSPVDLLNELTQGIFLDNGVQDGRFTGVRANGLPYRMRADEVTLIDRNQEQYRITAPDLKLETETGDLTTATAATGLFDEETGLLSLNGLVRIVASTGERLLADTARVNVETESGTFSGGVLLEMDGSWISADSMAIEQVAADAPDGQKGIIRFEGNVRMMVSKRPETVQE